MSKRLQLAAFVLAMVAASVVVSSQVTVPYPNFVAGTVADPAQVNANFATLSTSALNRTGGTMTGALATQAVAPVTDATYSLGSSSFKFLDLFLSRNATVGGTLGVTGAITATAGQIAFPATQNPSADPNTIDDYEEGSWIPVIGGSGGTSGQTYGVQVGKYVKVGKKVTATFHATLTAKGTITASVQIQGLPFTADATANFQPICVIMFDTLGTNWVNVVGNVSAGTTVMGVVGAAAAGVSNTASLVTADITNTSSLYGTVTYLSTN